jgi:hypothetical protein
MQQPTSEGVRSGELIKVSRKELHSKLGKVKLVKGISGAQIFTFHDG